MKKSIGVKTMACPTPLWIVGTYDSKGTPNVMSIAWGGICCSKPQSVNISLRKATYSYNNILEKKAFTINIPSESYAKEADYFGIATGSKTNKFADTGLTPIKSDIVDAPYIKEFPLILECKMTHNTEIGTHTLFVGEIVEVKADESVLGENGLPDINKVLPVLFAPEVRTYHGIGRTLGKAFSIGKEIQGSNNKS